MINRILKRTSGRVTDKLARIGKYLYRKSGGKRSWKNRYAKVTALNPFLLNPVHPDVEKAHRNLWNSFGGRIDLATLRMCSNLSGNTDPRYIPEDLFVSDIEPSLEYRAGAAAEMNKSLYSLYYPKDLFPECFLHKVNGLFLDQDLNEIDEMNADQILERLSYPVIAKPGIGQYGGKGVQPVQNPAELKEILAQNDNIVVQEMASQHEWFSRFHPASVNTVRVYLYRSVKDNAVHLLSVDATFGMNRTFVNNETAGGIYAGADDLGCLKGYAVDKWGTTFSSHPDSGVVFKGQEIPFYDDLIRLSFKIASHTFSSRILGLDLFLDQNGAWKVMEVNTVSHSIRSAQYFGRPFFGDYTQEVIDYCQKNHWALRG